MSSRQFQAPREEHPFAGYVRILGKGKSGTRSLDRDEARHAFNMILRGEVEDLQLGAFLMLLRVKEESPEELAGFVDACRENFEGTAQNLAVPDLDWSSYAGKKAQNPWYLLSALLLSRNGIRVLMHGADGHTAGRLYSEQALATLGIAACDSLSSASHALQDKSFAYLPLRQFCPRLHQLMQLRPLLGLRSPVNTLARMLNPMAAPCSIQSVFHPAYMELHRGCDRLLGQANSMVYKGDGGEVEIKPQARTRLTLLQGDVDKELDWPRSLDGKPEAETALHGGQLALLWRDEIEHEYGALATCHTAATALYLLGRADSATDALAIAEQWWQQRDRDFLPCP